MSLRSSEHRGSAAMSSICPEPSKSSPKCAAWWGAWGAWGMMYAEEGGGEGDITDCITDYDLLRLFVHDAATQPLSTWVKRLGHWVPRSFVEQMHGRWEVLRAALVAGPQGDGGGGEDCIIAPLVSMLQPVPFPPPLHRCAEIHFAADDDLHAWNLRNFLLARFPTYIRNTLESRELPIIPDGCPAGAGEERVGGRTTGVIRFAFPGGMKGKRVLQKAFQQLWEVELEPWRSTTRVTMRIMDGSEGSEGGGEGKGDDDDGEGGSRL